VIGTAGRLVGSVLGNETLAIGVMAVASEKELRIRLE
jgi:hypothetical protein